MSFLTKLMDTMRLDNDEDDDYFLDDDYEEDEKPEHFLINRNKFLKMRKGF